MKTVKEIRCAIMAEVWKIEDSISVDRAKQDQILQEWAESIIEECASTFRWEWDCQDEHDAVEIVDPDTINDVKAKL